MTETKYYTDREEMKETLEQLGELLNQLPFKLADMQALFELIAGMTNDVLIEHGQEPFFFVIKEYEVQYTDRDIVH